MIENIKRIVNEHRTLMVVIIGVLVICFIYWWFFCKGRPSANKGGAGGLFDVVVKNSKDSTIRSRNEIIGSNLVFFISVLNNNGIQFMRGLFGDYENPFKKHKYITDVFYGYRFVDILTDPLTPLGIQPHYPEYSTIGLRLFGPHLLAQLTNIQMDEFNFVDILNHVLDENTTFRILTYIVKLNSVLDDDPFIDLATFIGQPNKITGRDKYTDENYTTYKKFLEIKPVDDYDSHEAEEVIPYDNEDMVERYYYVKERIDELELCFKEMFAELGDVAEFTELYNKFTNARDGFMSLEIDQDSEISEEVFEKINEYYGEIGEIDDEIGEYEEEYMRRKADFVQEDEPSVSGGDISLSTKTDYGERVDRTGHFLIDGTTKLCRKWYNIKPDINTLKQIFTDFYLDNNGSIKFDKSHEIETNCADIYPAEKVAMFILYICLYKGVEKRNNSGEIIINVLDELGEMIAAYVLYVYLFNTCCACNMEESWNKTLSNEYVYEYKPKITNGQMMVFKDAAYNAEQIKRNLNDEETLAYLIEISNPQELMSLINSIPNDKLKLMFPLLSPEKAHFIKDHFNVIFDKNNEEDRVEVLPTLEMLCKSDENINKLIDLRIKIEDYEEQIKENNGKSWTQEEDSFLKRCVACFNGTDIKWDKVALAMVSNEYYRNQGQCKSRWDKNLDPMLKKDSWTNEEDEQLFNLVRQYGDKNKWSTIASAMGNRSDVQCRYRYKLLMKYQQPSIPPPTQPAPPIAQTPTTINLKIGDTCTINGTLYRYDGNGRFTPLE